ncbi:MAG TPA: spermidine/putrescine ABC transporter substrate-binding protein [Candidatus Limnocylindrales bacterium]|nr:spermidine/putrescine ABC transporter substrate-binding protein [Candidatus Limnocylindrales bacterium]
MDRDTLTTTPITRRRLLAGGSLTGVAVFLAACGTKGSAATPAASGAPAASAAPGASTAPVESAAAAQTPSAEVNWANWTYYMDVDENDPNLFPSLQLFTDKHGTKVNYSEVVNDNEEFFGTIQPALQGGADTGWDIVTLTDWMAAKLIRLGWVETFDVANMPNFTANLLDTYRGVDWDPEGNRHAPWQSGMTGLGYNPDKTGELTSLAAFFTADDRWKGKVDFLSEMRDAIGLTMLKLGLDPAKPTREACDQAVAELMKARDAKIVRAFKGNEYAEDLKSGNVVLAMAWSGDMIQVLAEKPSMKFTIADEGGMLWTDNSVIPKGAAHKYTAELLMDWYYQPDIAAMVTAYVNYICPVKGTAEILKAEDPEMADNPLIFPPADVQAKLHIFGGLTEEDESYFNEQFATVTGKG